MIITAKKIITGDGKTVLTDSAVYVKENGKIGKIGTVSELKVLYPEEEVVDYPNSTLLPGLVDLHAHLGHWGCRPAPSVMNDYMMAYITQKHAQDAFKRGVTTLREVCSPEGVCQTMKAASEMGFLKFREWSTVVPDFVSQGDMEVPSAWEKAWRRQMALRRLGRQSVLV